MARSRRTAQSRLFKRTRLGRWLTTYRAIHGLGVRELAHRIGLSAATLSRLERGGGIEATTLIRLWLWILEPDDIRES